MNNTTYCNILVSKINNDFDNKLMLREKDNIYSIIMVNRYYRLPIELINKVKCAIKKPLIDYENRKISLNIKQWKQVYSIEELETYYNT